MRTFLFTLLVLAVANVVSAAPRGLKGVRRLEAPAPEEDTTDVGKDKCKHKDKETHEPKETHAPKGKATEAPKEHEKKSHEPKATHAPKKEPDECDEEEDEADDGSVEEVAEPSLGSGVKSNTAFENIELDCDAIANNTGPTDTPSVSLMANMDILKEAGMSMSQMYTLMELILQSEVAPQVAGCSDSRRKLEETTSETMIVNVDFGNLEFDRRGCSSTMTAKATETGDACLATDMPVDIYYVGVEDSHDFSERVKDAIEAHQWNVEGVQEVSDVRMEVTETPSSPTVPVGAFAAIVAVVLAVCLCGAWLMKSQDEEDKVKGEYEDTDEDSFTKGKEKKYDHDDDDDDDEVPVASATRVYEP